MRVGIDVDGIVAAFNGSYIDLIKQHTGLELPPESDTYPDEWSYEKAAMRKAGMAEDKISATMKGMWAEIGASNSFWATLPAYPEATSFLQKLSSLMVDTYFITSRTGLTAKPQTEFWLMAHGLDHFPTVLVTQTRESTKGSICYALGLTHYIDDKDENCQDVLKTSPATECYMLRRPWNHKDICPRLDGLMDFMEVLRTDYAKEAA